MIGDTQNKQIASTITTTDIEHTANMATNIATNTPAEIIPSLKLEGNSDADSEKKQLANFIANENGNKSPGSPNASTWVPVVDEFFIASLLHKICPTRFTQPWLCEYRLKYESSYLDNKSTPTEASATLFTRLSDRKTELYAQNIYEILVLLASEQNNCSDAKLNGDGEQLCKEIHTFLTVPSIRTSALFSSILLHLVKLVHSTIESDRGCFTFYQIFSNLFTTTTEEDNGNVFHSKSMAELNNLISSLASFDRNIGDVLSSNQQHQHEHKQLKHQHQQQQQQQRSREEQISGSSTTSGYGRCSTTTSPEMDSLDAAGGHGSPTIFGTGLSQATMAQLKHPIATMIGLSAATTPSTVSTDYTVLLHPSQMVATSGAEDVLADLPPSLVSPPPVSASMVNELARLRLRNNSGYTSASGGSFPSPTLGSDFGLLNENCANDSSASTSFFGDLGGGYTGETSDFAPRPVLGNFPNAKNQCFTLTMNHQQQQQQAQHAGLSKSSMMKGSLSAQLSPFSDDYLMAESPQAKTNAGVGNNLTGRLEKDHLYRLIISQLLHDNHRAIANQLAVAERIKSDGSLVTPNDRLHDLVSMAIKREIDLMSANNNSARLGVHTSNSMNYMDNLKENALTLDDSHHHQHNQSFTKSMEALNSSVFLKGSDLYERPSSMTNSFLAPTSTDLFGTAAAGAGNGASGPVAIVGQSKCLTDLVDSALAGPAPSVVDYGDVPLDSVTELYQSPIADGMGRTGTGVTEIFYGRVNSCSGTTMGPTKQAERAMRSMSVSERQIRSSAVVNKTPAAGVIDGVQSSASGLILNEAGLNNLNQLAKLSATDGSLSSCTMTSSLMATANGACGAVYGRASSAMATLPNGSSSSSTDMLASITGVSRCSAISPVGNRVVIGGTTNTTGSANTSHTTGNGKNHNVMEIRAKFGSLGSGNGQFSSPHGFCLGMNDEIVIADTNNHRICIYDKNGAFKHSFGIPGKDEAQLWYPRKIAMICSANVRGTLQNPYYVICDRGMERSRMQIFTRTGNFVRKIPIRYIDIVAGIAINAQGQIVAVDSVSPTVFIITESGELTHWFDCSNHMREPSDIAIYKNDYYICDFKGHCVVVLTEKGQFIRKIGMEGLTSFPNGIDISMRGDILVGDSHGNRFHVVVFNHDGKLLSEFECPYVKVSRCCGLKLTSEGYIVTLAKNNHHVLVLNTIVLYQG